MSFKPSQLTVFVRGLRLEAQVGVHHHEKGRSQPLLVDVDLRLPAGEGHRLADTFNYETVRREALALAAGGHFELVETFAARLANALMADPRLTLVRVRIEKPQALAPDAAGAGVELILEREA